MLNVEQLWLLHMIVGFHVDIQRKHWLLTSSMSVATRWWSPVHLERLAYLTGSTRTWVISPKMASGEVRGLRLLRDKGWSPAFSPILSPSFVCLPELVSGLVSHFLVFQLVWDAVSASLGLSPNLSHTSTLDISGPVVTSWTESLNTVVGQIAETSV